MKRFFLLAVLAVFCSCNTVPLYVWEGVSPDIPSDTLRQWFSDWKAHGVTGVCIGSADTATVRRASALAHAAGLEYHAWVPCMPQEGLPAHWYAVNRLGQRACDFPAFVPHYKFLDPHNPEVRAWLRERLLAIAALPDVDYVQLDYIRYPDVILARGLWEKYGLDMHEEYAPADYCYCDACVADFQARTGLDIRTVEDPSAVPEWARFRCESVTGLVCELVDAIHACGKKVSADVFPGPDAYARRMVRQAWNEWPVDMLFPMNYNDFYLEDASWVGTITADEVQAAGSVPVMCGLFICPDWRNKATVTDPEASGLLPAELARAARAALRSGASGLCLFTPSRMSPEHWSALQHL